jgi:hypothetical protein
MDVGVIVADGNVVGWISKKVGVEVGIGDGVVVGTAACVPITSVFAKDMAVSIALVEFISGDEAKWLQDVNNAIARNNKILGLLMIFMIADQALAENYPERSEWDLKALTQCADLSQTAHTLGFC